MRFRKRVTVFPGFTLNLSKTGLSATVGIKGLSVNVGKNGTYLNTGLPGTGLYDRTRLDKPKQKESKDFESPEEITQGFFDYKEIKSLEPEFLTSNELFGLKKAILESKEEKKKLKEEVSAIKNRFFWFSSFMVLSFACLVGLFFLKKIIAKFRQLKEEKEDLILIYQNYCLSIDFFLDNDMKKEYEQLEQTFKLMAGSTVIWDITSSQAIDKVKQRTSASKTVERKNVVFEQHILDFIKTEYQPLTLRNANGADIYIYPGFIISFNQTNSEFAIISFKDINFSHHSQKFIEDEKVPADTEIIDYTWKYVNKNGSPDKRYSNNYKIPIVLYHEFALISSSGLNECYQVSNAKNTEMFSVCFSKYLQSVQGLKWGTSVE